MKSLEDVEQWLRPLTARTQLTKGRSLTLERTQQLAALFDNPHDKLKVVHIAGTSGKTSTSYYIATQLRATGSNVGLSVSPHIDRITERVQINGTPLNEAQFCDYFSRFAARVDKSSITPTYFEAMIVFAYWVFQQEDVDYVVMETGLGGLYDSTNIASRVDKVCVITDIGFDHQHVLGNTLPEITAQKAGIIHPHNHVFMHAQSDEIMTILDNVARRNGVVLCAEPFLPNELFPRRNWVLAERVVKYIAERDGLVFNAKLSLQDVIVPGRRQEFIIEGKRVIFDGAHNEQKMNALLRSLEHEGAIATLIAFKDSKDFQVPLRLVADRSERVIATAFTGYQDTPLVAVDPNVLHESESRVEVVIDATKAFTELLRTSADCYVVTGSFYLIGQLRKTLDLA